jgi:hypothetical protein
LAREGEQYSPQFLSRFEEERRYATLVASLVELAATLTDTALEMHDRIMGNLFKQGQQKQRSHFEQRGQAINEKVRLYATGGFALITAKEQATDPYQALENEKTICYHLLPGRSYVRGERPKSSAPLEAQTYLAERGKELHEQLTCVGRKLSENALPDVRRDADKVRITPPLGRDPRRRRRTGEKSLCEGKADQNYPTARRD